MDCSRMEFREILVFFYCLMVHFITGALSLKVTMKAPAVVNVTDPLNITCLVTYEGTPVNDIRLVKLFNESTEVLSNSALTLPFRADPCQRYSAHGLHDSISVSFTLSVQAAFKRDGGNYTCIVYERSDLRPLERTWTKRIRVTGDYSGEVEEQMEQDCMSTPVPETTSTVTEPVTSTVTMVITEPHTERSMGRTRLSPRAKAMKRFVPAPDDVTTTVNGKTNASMQQSSSSPLHHSVLLCSLTLIGTRFLLAGC